MLVRKSKKGPYAGKFDDGRICLTIVLQALAKALSDKMCLFFTTNYRTVRVIFVVISPSNANSFLAWRKCCTLKGISSLQTGQFSLHRIQPDRTVWSIGSFVVRVRGFVEVPIAITEERERG